LEPLNTVDEHRSVHLFENVRPDLDHVVRSDAQDVRIESGMMKPAQRETVGYDRFALWVQIRNDVRGVEQRAMP
jgi:hypothetical protein